MSDPNLSDNTVWGAIATGATAIVGAFAWAKGWRRGERVAEAGADVSVAASSATERIIKMLTERVNELVEEVHKLRAEIRQLIHQNNDCEGKNLQLTNQVEKLTNRVNAVERDGK